MKILDKINRHKMFFSCKESTLVRLREYYTRKEEKLLLSYVDYQTRTNELEGKPCWESESEIKSIKRNRKKLEKHNAYLLKKAKRQAKELAQAERLLKIHFEKSKRKKEYITFLEKQLGFKEAWLVGNFVCPVTE